MLKNLGDEASALALDHLDEAFLGFVAEEFVDFLGDGGHAEGFGDEGVETGAPFNPQET